MSEKTHSHFPIPPVDSLPQDMQETIKAVEDKAGFIPNVFSVLSHRPDEFRAFFAYHDALMEKDSGLSKGEREMIVVVTSALNNCLYCVVAHGAIARIREKNPLLSDQLAINYKVADITARQRAMLDFACKLSDDCEVVEQPDFDKLLAHDFSMEDIWDIGAIVAFFALSNRMVSLTGMMPNAPFYGMGRDS